jgi:hypothetical protein
MAATVYPMKKGINDLPENMINNLIQVPMSRKRVPITILTFIPHLFRTAIARKLLGKYIIQKIRFIILDPKTERSYIFIRILDEVVQDPLTIPTEIKARLKQARTTHR